MLVHGHYGNLAEYDELGPLLARHARVVAYDQRGQGWSESGPIDTEAMANDLGAVVAALGLDRPVLFGSSFGTLACLAYLWHGGEAAGFVSQDGRASDFVPDATSPPPPPAGPHILDPTGWERHVAEFGRAGAIGVATAVRSGVRRPDGRYEVRPSPDDVVAKQHAVIRLPVLDADRKVNGPILMLAAEHGLSDAARRQAELEAFAEATGAAVRWFPTGHWISAEDPDGVVEAVLPLLGPSRRRPTHGVLVSSTLDRCDGSVAAQDDRTRGLRSAPAARITRHRSLPGGCQAVIPVHAGEEIPTGTLRSIERALEPCLGKGWRR